MNKLAIKFASEFAGTFLLVFLGCGSIVLSELSIKNFTHAEISLIFGSTVGLMIYAVARFSGAHFNPAVSLGFWINKKLSTEELFGYLTMQLTAAIFASNLHLNLWNRSHSFGMTRLSVSTFTGVLLEFLMTFTLMSVILWISRGKKIQKKLSGFAIGFTISLCSYFGGPYTGASMNPARSFGPALIGGDLSSIWLYIFVPCLGAFFAVWVNKRLQKKGA